MPANHRAKRERRWLENPNCHWCGLQTIPPAYCPKFFRNRMATMDHLVDRLDPNRGKVKGKLVIACFRCNVRRADKKVKQLSLEEQWKRSGAYPQGHPLARDRYHSTP